jgi:hypothetical protein
MTLAASRLAEEERLSPELLRRSLGVVEPTEEVQLGRGREVEELLELRHVVDLAAASLEHVHALLRRHDRIAVGSGYSGV